MNDWIKWNGGDCPVHPETIVEYKMRYGSFSEDKASDIYWDKRGEPGDIIAYRVIEEHPLTIAETIREAAINWPVFLGDVESNILHAFGPNTFCGEGGVNDYLWGTEEDQFQARTFMLFVAEALE